MYNFKRIQSLRKNVDKQTCFKTKGSPLEIDVGEVAGVLDRKYMGLLRSRFD